jgi:hypothetical protein
MTPASPPHITFTLSPPPLRRGRKIAYVGSADETEEQEQHEYNIHEARRHEPHRVRIPRNFTGGSIESNWGLDVHVHQVPVKTINDTFAFETRPAPYCDNYEEDSIYASRQAFKQNLKDQPRLIEISENDNETIEIEIRRVKKKRKSEADSLMDDNASYFQNQPFNSPYLYSSYH